MNKKDTNVINSVVMLENEIGITKYGVNLLCIILKLETKSLNIPTCSFLNKMF